MMRLNPRFVRKFLRRSAVALGAFLAVDGIAYSLWLLFGRTGLLFACILSCILAAVFILTLFEEPVWEEED